MKKIDNRHEGFLEDSINGQDYYDYKNTKLFTKEVESSLVENLVALRYCNYAGDHHSDSYGYTWIIFDESFKLLPQEECSGAFTCTPIVSHIITESFDKKKAYLEDAIRKTDRPYFEDIWLYYKE